MRKLGLFPCLGILLDVLAGFGFLPMPVARAQSLVPRGITFVTTALNWTQTISSSLRSGSQATVTLTPCPVGIDTTSGAGYQVLVSGGGKSEAVSVITTLGGCTSGAASGTIKFTPFYSYAAGYTIGSASSGVQETLNAACGTTPLPNWGDNGQCHVIIATVGPGDPHLYNTYNVYGTIFFHMNSSELDGYGVILNCLGRGPCLQVGDLVSSNDAPNNNVKGLIFRAAVAPTSDAAYAGVNVTNTVRSSGYDTITTAVAHHFRPGDWVTIQFTDDASYWGDALVTDCGSGSSSAICTSSSTTFRYVHAGSVGAQATPGVVALAYSAVLDNAMATHFYDISYSSFDASGSFNTFFDIWDDENATIDHFNNAPTHLNASATWSGSYIFSMGSHGYAPSAPVITLNDSNITANYSSGVTVLDSNGVYINNTVIQASGLWQVHVSTDLGNYQGVAISNLYSESGTYLNPPCSPSCPTGARTPYPGTGVAGLIVGNESSAATNTVEGPDPQGWLPTGGSGSTSLEYFIVVHDTTRSTYSSPLPILQWGYTKGDNPVINWPRVAQRADIILYDVIRMGVVNTNSPLPSYGNCPGGSLTACGSVATGLAQCAGLVCTYTDTGAPNTSAYPVNPGTYSSTGGGELSLWPKGTNRPRPSARTSSAYRYGVLTTAPPAARA